MIVLAIGDTHAPFVHADALDFLRDLKREYKPDKVVHIGDLGDQYGWKRHEDQDPDALSPKDEDEACLKWCRKLYKIFPDVDACIGNHDERLAKAMKRAGVPSRLCKSIREIYDSPAGWRWQRSYIYDGVAHLHGEGFSGPDAAVKAAQKICRSAAIGHCHTTAGVRWFSTDFSRVFGLSVGCLVDPESFAFAYTKKYAARPVLGSAVVIDGVPQFIPMGSI